MKILIFGKDGMVGSYLKYLSRNNKNIVSFGKNDINFEDFDQLRYCIKKNTPDIIVNAAAYTNVALAQKEKEKSFVINSEAVRIISEEVEKLNSLLIHYSTDYIFDGNKNTPYDEEDSACPLQVYGESKLKGEKYIKSINCNYLILRTSWVYSENGSNFLTKIIESFDQNHEVKVVENEEGTPTSAFFLAINTLKLINKFKKNNLNVGNSIGTYNLTPLGATNRYEFAKLIISNYLKLKKIDKFNISSIVKSINSSSIKNEFNRPTKVLLLKNKFIKKFDIKLHHWQYGLSRIVMKYMLSR